jgi:hypothetical protein
MENRRRNNRGNVYSGYTRAWLMTSDQALESRVISAVWLARSRGSKAPTQ